MNMVKLNNKLTAQVISFTGVVQSYQGIEQTSHFYTYHRENGAEVLDIDFRLKVNDNGLVVSINKSYDKDTISGGHYTQDTQAEVDINPLKRGQRITEYTANRLTAQQTGFLIQFFALQCGKLWKLNFIWHFTQNIKNVRVRLKRRLKFYLKSYLILQTATMCKKFGQKFRKMKKE